jgi:hypothetical protein
MRICHDLRINAILGVQCLVVFVLSVLRPKCPRSVSHHATLQETRGSQQLACDSLRVINFSALTLKEHYQFTLFSRESASDLEQLGMGHAKISVTWHCFYLLFFMDKIWESIRNRSEKKRAIVFILLNYLISNSFIKIVFKKNWC